MTLFDSECVQAREIVLHTILRLEVEQEETVRAGILQFCEDMSMEIAASERLEDIRDWFGSGDLRGAMKLRDRAHLGA